MPGDSFNPEDEDYVEGFGSGSSAGAAKPVSYQSTGGTTPVGGSPGFVNLGQMLALNKTSGANSAAALNKSVSDKATSAQNDITNASNTFKSQYDQNVNKFDPNADLGKANAGANNKDYKGPENLDDIGKLDDGQTEETRNKGLNITKVRDNVSQAQGLVDSLASPGGVAANVAQTTSLAPRQAAASSFYMGNSNPDFAATNQKFKGLSDMLTKASKDATALGKTGQDATSANARAYEGLAAQRQNSQDDSDRQIAAGKTHQAELDASDLAAYNKDPTGFGGGQRKGESHEAYVTRLYKAQKANYDSRVKSAQRDGRPPPKPFKFDDPTKYNYEGGGGDTTAETDTEADDDGNGGPINGSDAPYSQEDNESWKRGTNYK